MKLFLNVSRTFVMIPGGFLVENMQKYRFSVKKKKKSHFSSNATQVMTKPGPKNRDRFFSFFSEKVEKSKKSMKNHEKS